MAAHAQCNRNLFIIFQFNWSAKMCKSTTSFQQANVCKLRKRLVKLHLWKLWSLLHFKSKRENLIFISLVLTPNCGRYKGSRCNKYKDRKQLTSQVIYVFWGRKCHACCLCHFTTESILSGWVYTFWMLKSSRYICISKLSLLFAFFYVTTHNSGSHPLPCCIQK